MKTAMDILQKKRHKEIFSISPKSPVFDALELMSDKEIGALMVINEKGDVAGIFSERDYARKIILKGKSSKDTKVEDVMTPASKMYTANPESSIDDCMGLVTERHIRHIPVFDKGKFIGLVSIGDIVKSMLSEKQHVIDQLSNYIAGKY